MGVRKIDITAAQVVLLFITATASGQSQRSLTFTSARSGAFNTYVQRLASSLTPLGAPSQITSAIPGFEARMPDWSLQDRIAYQSGASGARAIHSVNPDGSDNVRLTPPPSSGGVCPSDARDPSWSPDGRFLVYACLVSGIYNLWVHDTNNTPQITNDDSDYALVTSGVSKLRPAWSPDNSKIAFVQSNQIAVVPIVFNPTSNRFQAGTPGLLTNNAFMNFDPTWSPDGQYLAYSTTRNGSRDIYTMSSTAGESTNIRLTFSVANDTAPAWSPDGGVIAFVSDRDGNPEIYVMDSSVGDVTFPIRITNDGSEDSDPAWMPSFVIQQSGKGQGSCSCPDSQPGQVPAGDPADLGSGNLYEQFTDYATQGQNVLAFMRYYNSRANLGPMPFAATFGLNWRSNFDRYLQLSVSTTLAERADGRILSFTRNNDVWTPDSDVDLRLTQDGSSWTLIGVDDATETYAAIGPTKAVLTKIQSRNGYAQTLNYDANNRLTNVTDSFGRSLDFTYANGFLHTFSTPDSQTFTYDYDASIPGGPLDRLISITYSTTPATRQIYVYENPTFLFALTGIIDENGKRYTTWTYDRSGRVTSSQHASGADLTTIKYNDVDGSRTVTNPLGLKTTYKFTLLQGLPKVTEITRSFTATTPAATMTKTYDANGYLASETDWNGNLTEYVNDSRGLPTQITEAAGTVQSRTTTILYDSTFHLPVKTVKPGVTTELTYDSSGNLVEKVETDTTTTTLPYSTNGIQRTWNYTWSEGLLRSVTGPRAIDHTQYDYDASGTLVTVMNALNQTTRTTSHTPGGLPLEIVDPNGVTTTFAYDKRLRPVTKTVMTDKPLRPVVRSVMTGSGPLITTYEYDRVGNLLKTTLPDGSAMSSTYDDAHRLTDQTDLFGQRTSYTLDAMGNRKQTAVMDANNVVTRTHAAAFDALGQMIQNTGGAGQSTQYGLDANGNVLTLTDPLVHVTQQFFDPLNRVFQVVDPSLGTTATTYDENDRPLSITAPNGAVTTYIYDGFGNRIQTLSPDSGKTVYRFDLGGNVTQRVDATGATVNYTYDALNRVLTANYPGAPAENVTYRYDEVGHGFGVGRLTSVTDAVGTLSRVYDERGNVVRETRVRGSVTLLTSYTYDGADRIASIRYPSGGVAAYSRDVMGRVTGVTFKPSASSAALPVISGIAYQPFGPVSAFTYGNGISETREFDLDYRLTNLTDTGNNPVQDLTYNYDGADNVRSIADGVNPNKSQDFQYDALDQLTNATGAYGNLVYTYDASGNRLSQQAGAILTTYSYTPNSNRLTEVSTGTNTQVYFYTPAGNIANIANRTSTRPTTGIAYNQAGRLSTVVAGGAQQLRYTYDAFGNRLVKSGVATGTTLFQYDLARYLLEDSYASGNARVDYVYLADTPIGTYQWATGRVYFLHSDRLGTPQAATDSAQATVWSANYEPFGATSTGIGTIVQNLRLPGQEFEADTGWNHNGFRDYAQSLGRFVESDPIGLRGGLNRYTYVANSPINFADPLGLYDTSGMKKGASQAFQGFVTYVGGLSIVAASTGPIGWAVGASVAAYGAFYEGVGVGRIIGASQDMPTADLTFPGKPLVDLLSSLGKSMYLRSAPITIPFILEYLDEVNDALDSIESITESWLKIKSFCGLPRRDSSRNDLARLLRGGV